MGANKRVALKPHIEQIREWVDVSRTDEWIAHALGTSASSVQSFRSRNGIHRRSRTGAHEEPESVFEAVLDHGEEEGYGLWLDPSVAEDPIWKEHWANVESIVVKVADGSIVLEPDSTERPMNGDPTLPSGGTSADGDGPCDVPPSPPRERGRVKWFDAERGYGFLAHPDGRDLFVSSLRGAWRS